MAGGRHDGATLTDTILVASYNLNTNQLHIISIPRDLWLPSLASKANAVYQAGLSQKNGLAHTKVVIGNVVGLPIHYGLRIDFQGFIDAVNILGGIDIEVQNSFDDYLYPITGKENDLCGWEEVEKEFNEEEAKKLNIEQGKRKVFVKDAAIATDSAEEDKGVKYFSCRFEHINFDKGLTHMDGETALKFVRSRHGNNNEGTDFARSKRQQKLLLAVKDKALSLETLLNPIKLKELYDAYSNNVETDVDFGTIQGFYLLSKQTKFDDIKSIVLDDRSASREGGLLYAPEDTSLYGGAYVLIPRVGDFSQIHAYVQKFIFEQ